MTLTTSQTKYLKLPVTDSTDALVNFPDTNKAALDIVDAWVGNPPRASVYSSNSAWAPVKSRIQLPLDTVLNESHPGMLTNNAVKVPADGLYQVDIFTIAMEPLTGNAYRDLQLSVNGTGTGHYEWAYTKQGFYGAISGHWQVELAAGDLVAGTASGDTESVRFGTSQLQICRIAPLTGLTPRRHPAVSPHVEGEPS